MLEVAYDQVDFLKSDISRNVICLKEGQKTLEALVDPSSPLESCIVERSIEAGDDHSVFGRTGMDEFVASHIDTDMVDIASSSA